MWSQDRSNSVLYSLQIDTSNCGFSFDAISEYNSAKNAISTQRKELYQDYTLLIDSIDKDQFLDSISDVFSSLLLNRLMPFWYGTKWDFDGYTAKPNNGVVACGYLVSTTLRDNGMNLNRYHLAQQVPRNEDLSIAVNGVNFIEIYPKEEEEEEEGPYDFLNDLNQGFYFAGVENHVGFLYKTKDDSYFIHSNYIDGFVMAEKAKYSQAFESRVYYLAKITGNMDLMKHWLEGEELKIIR